MTASPRPAPGPNAEPVTPAVPATPGAVPPPVAPTGAQGTPATEPSIGKLVSDASAHVSTIVRGEIELAKLELRSSIKNAGVGAGAFAAAAIVLVFSLIYLFQAIAETLARYVVPRFVAFFIVFGLLVLVGAVLVLFGIRKVKRVKAPERTIRTTKQTVDYLKKSRG